MHLPRWVTDTCYDSRSSGFLGLILTGILVGDLSTLFGILIATAAHFLTKFFAGITMIENE
jgi:hypothetical protein